MENDYNIPNYLNLGSVKKMCPIHRQSIVEKYCFQLECQEQSKCICKDCILAGLHRTHNQLPIEQVLKKLQQSSQFYQDNIEQKEPIQIFKQELLAQMKNLKEAFIEKINEFENDFLDFIKELDHNYVVSNQENYYKFTLKDLLHSHTLGEYPDQEIMSFHQNLLMAENEEQVFNDLIAKKQGFINKHVIKSKAMKIFDQLDKGVKEMFNELKAYLLQYGQETKGSKEHKGGVQELVQLNDQFYASSSTDQTIKIWDINQKQSIQTIQCESMPQNTLIKFGEECLIYSQAKHNEIILYNWLNSKQLKKFRGHLKPITKIIQLDFFRFISCSEDKYIRIWDIMDDPIISQKEGQPLQQYVQSVVLWQAHTSSVNSIIKLNDDIILSLGKDSFIKLWKLSTQTCIKSTKNNDNNCLYDCIQLDTKNIAIGTNYGKVIVYSIPHLVVEKVLEGNYGGSIYKLYKLNMDYIVALCGDRLILIKWMQNKRPVHLSQGKMVQTLVDFGKKILIYGLNDGTISYINLNIGR